MNTSQFAPTEDFVRAAVSNILVATRGPLRLDMYSAMSAMQKAVRLGDTGLAVAAARSLLDGGCAAASWGRLRTIAVEDVGAGDPQVAAFVLWLAAQRTLREELGDLRLSVVALQFLCAATKSRDMCDVFSWAVLPGAIDHLMPEFVREESPALVAIASDPAGSFRTRHAAARALFPAKFRGVERWRRRPAEDRLALFDALRMPADFVSMIEADLAFGGDALASAGPLVWAVLSGSMSIGSGPDVLDPGEFPVVGGVLCSTYDRHTRLGHRVLAQILREHAPWKDFFHRHPAAHPKDCLLRAVFYVEGGILRPRLQFDRSMDLYWSVLEAKFASTGIASMEDGGWELLQLVQEAIPQINEVRRRSLTGQAPSDSEAFPRHSLRAPTYPPQDTPPQLTGVHGRSNDPLAEDTYPADGDALERFSFRQGDQVAAPLLEQDTSEVTLVPIPVALARIEAMGRGATAGTLLCPLTIDAPPIAEPRLDLTSYLIARVPIHTLTSVVSVLDRLELAARVEGSAKASLPLVVMRGSRAFLYHGVEEVVARSLLGESDVVVKIVIS